MTTANKGGVRAKLVAAIEDAIGRVRCDSSAGVPWNNINRLLDSLAAPADAGSALRITRHMAKQALRALDTPRRQEESYAYEVVQAYVDGTLVVAPAAGGDWAEACAREIEMELPDWHAPEGYGAGFRSARSTSAAILRRHAKDAAGRGVGEKLNG